MSRLRSFGSAAVLAAFVYAGCSDRVAGGTSETENMVGARMLRVDSLLSLWSRPESGAIVAILRLDSSNFPFAHSSASGRDLAVERHDGSPVPFRIVYWDKFEFRGRIEVLLDRSLLVPGSQIRLRWGLDDSIRTDSAGVWRSIPDSLRERLTTVLVDDFEHAGIQSLLPDPGWWYSFASDSETTVSEPEISPAGEGRLGNALLATYHSPSPDQGFVYMGLSLTKPRAFRSLDSMVFWARGPGSLVVAFDKLDDNAGKAIQERVLDSTWVRIVVRPRDLDSADGIGGNVGWDRVRDSVTNLTFFISHGTELRLDDIRLHGVNIDDLR